mgnify:CR=1 FL=1
MRDKPQVRASHQTIRRKFGRPWEIVGRWANRHTLNVQAWLASRSPQARLVERRGAEALARMVRQRPQSMWPEWLVDESTDDHHVVEVFTQSLLSIAEPVLVQILRGAALSELPEANRLKQLKQPALVLAWTEDISHPLKTAEKLHSLLPNSRLVTASSCADVASWPVLIRRFLSDSGTDHSCSN